MTSALNSKENSPLPIPSQRLRSVGELKELLTDYAPNKQVALCKDKELCYFGTSPTLADVNRDYDPLAARAFIIPQLTDIAKFSNCTNILKAAQINECADMITSQYYYLKMSEFMLFCWKFKNGEYGQFYGSVSPMVIMGSLRQFIRERNDEIFRYEARQREKQREASRQNTMTYQEFYAPKAKAIIDYFYTILSVLLSFIGLTIKKKVQQ